MINPKALRMKTINTPTNSTELKHAIMQLNSELASQELVVRHRLKELYYSLQLSTVIRRTVKDITQDKEVTSSALQAGIDIGSGFLLDKMLLRKGYGIKSYLVNIGLKKLVSFLASGGKLRKVLASRLQPEEEAI